MAVRWWSYIRARGTRGLTRGGGRKKLVKIFDLMVNKIPKLLNDLDNKEKGAIACADETRTYKSMDNIFKKYDLIRNLIHEIVSNQIILIYRTQKREIKNEKNFFEAVNKLYPNLNDEDKKLLNECNNLFQKTREQIDNIVNLVRTQERDLLFQREKLFKYLTVHSTEASLAASKRYFITESQLSTQEKSEEKKIEKLISSIESLFNKIKNPGDLQKNQKEISNQIKKLKSELDKLLAIIRDEVAIIAKIFRRITVFRMKLFFDLSGHQKFSSHENGSIYKKIKELENMGFNPKLKEELNEVRIKILQKIRKNYYYEEKLIKHEKRISLRTSDKKLSSKGKQEKFKQAA